MNVISMFYGIIVSMVYEKNNELKSPHIFVLFQDTQSIFSIPDGTFLSGNLPFSKQKLVQAWIEIHKDELIANWQLIVVNQNPYKINPLN